MTRIADEQRERAKQAELELEAMKKAVVMHANAATTCYRARVDAEWLAADALRIGLEECERLRRRLEDEANHRRYLYGELLDCTRVLGIDFDGDTVEQCRDLAKRLGDREKVGEWWEVRVGGSVRRACQTNAEAKNYIQTRWWGHDARVMRVVHVTRWRKR